ncbi:DUF397 domain-containing protein [Haloechinothrix sp. LS1_15]|uniref:DUF397 domain-containing protein n=1 Tax=Haloechinothrix sp. LS1_15 TaxID=2652248 RepID=UPI002944F0D3|nr:DUF397 domain-containing protein [Haloechinothrix sp. LS1_15]MDV6014406.1 DUF397 domain-containing protein [Haloechinothrix sp. LS1_15]
MPAREHTGLTWRTSSYSGGNGDCVEVAWRTSAVAVRDSKDPDGGILQAPVGAWRAFLATLR